MGVELFFQRQMAEKENKYAKGSHDNLCKKRKVGVDFTDKKDETVSDSMTEHRSEEMHEINKNNKETSTSYASFVTLNSDIELAQLNILPHLLKFPRCF